MCGANIARLTVGIECPDDILGGIMNSGRFCIVCVQDQ